MCITLTYLILRRAVINFASLSGRSPGKTSNDPRTGQEVAALLEQAGVSGVVLNACDSARVSSDTQGLNLAEIFLRARLAFVVATSASIMEQTVEVFIRILYQSLLLKRTSISEAVHNARLQLVRSRIRRAHFRQEVHLEDFGVPVLYQNIQSTDGALERSADAPDVVELDDVDINPMFGRGHDILELELRIVTGRLLLIHGQGGIGKTTLLHYCASWWKTTAFIEDALYIRLPARREQSFTMAELENAICECLPGETSLINERGLVWFLRQRRYLLVLDDIEDARHVDEENLEYIRRFLHKATQGDTMIILCGRRNNCLLAGLVPNHNHYCLSGLSMHGALQLAGSCTSWIANRSTGKAAESFLERSLILLERSPLAIKLVFPALGTSLDTPEILFHRLLYGSVNIVYDLLASPRYFTHVMLIYIHLSFKEYAPFAPAMLVPFCNFFPTDLSNYFWFWWVPWLLPGSDVESEAKCATIADWAQPEWQQRVHEAMRVFGKGNFEKLIGKLVEEDILEEIQIRYTSGAVRQAYHINPVFTLMIRAVVGVTLRDARLEHNTVGVEKTKQLASLINTAFVSFQILGSKLELPRIAEDPIDRIVWDNEIQHSDHSTNNLVAAFGRSLDLDIMAEIKRHGMCTTDWIMGRSTMIFWENRRTAEILKPLIRHQILRLAIVATIRLKQYEIGHMLDYVYLLTQAEDYEISDVIEVSLRLFRKWKIRDREKLSPATELSWFQVRHAEAFIALRNHGEHTARRLFERNLADDPITTAADSEYHLDTEIMRTQWQNLQGWIECVKDESRNDPATVQGYSGFLKIIRAGDLGKLSYSMMEEDSPFHDAFKCLMQEMPLRDALGLNRLLQEHEETVAKFGDLAKSILAKPHFATWADESETLSDVGKQMMKEMTSGRMAQALQNRMQIAEFTLRYETSDDMAATMATLTKMLEKETSFSNTSWKKLDEIHDKMACVAIKHKDWVTAIRHLNERWDLHESNATVAGGETRLYCQFIICYSKLPNLSMAAVWSRMAASTMPGQAHEVWSFLEEEAPEVLQHLIEGEKYTGGLTQQLLALI